MGGPELGAMDAAVPRQLPPGTSVGMPGIPTASILIWSGLNVPWKAHASDTVPGQY